MRRSRPLARSHDRRHRSGRPLEEGWDVRRAFGGPGMTLGRFNFPWGMDLSPLGTSLYVVEMNGERVQEFAVVAS